MLIDVVIPTYNRPETLSRSIQSVLDQDKSLIGNIFVMDNGSDEDTLKLISSLMILHSNIRHTRWKSNIGPVRNWLRGLESCETEWIAILWSDDEFQPNGISELVAAITPEATSVSGRAQIEIPNKTWKAFSNKKLSLGYSEIVVALLKLPPQLPVSPAAGIIKRTEAIKGLTSVAYNEFCWDKAIGPDVGLFYWGSVNGGKHIHIPKVVAKFYGGNDSITMNTTRAVRSACYVDSMIQIANSTNYLLSKSAKSWIDHRSYFNKSKSMDAQVPSRKGKIDIRKFISDSISICRFIISGFLNR